MVKKSISEVITWKLTDKWKLCIRFLIYAVYLMISIYFYNITFPGESVSESDYVYLVFLIVFGMMCLIYMISTIILHSFPNKQYIKLQLICYRSKLVILKITWIILSITFVLTHVQMLILPLGLVFSIIFFIPLSAFLFFLLLKNISQKKIDTDNAKAIYTKKPAVLYAFLLLLSGIILFLANWFFRPWVTEFIILDQTFGFFGLVITATSVIFFQTIKYSMKEVVY